MPCMIATIDDQSDGACHTHSAAACMAAGSTTPQPVKSPLRSQLHHSSPPTQTLNCKITMPPVTRTQTRSLPTRDGDASPVKSPSVSRPLRHRKTATHRSNDMTTSTTASTDIPGNRPQSPPRFTIDLSLPPSERYSEVCHALGDEMRGLRSLFDEVVGGLLPSWLHVPTVLLNWVAWTFLWRVCDDEEDAEFDVRLFPSLHCPSAPPSRSL